MNATKRITIKNINCVSNAHVFQICESETVVTVYSSDAARKLAMALLGWSIYEAK